MKTKKIVSTILMLCVVTFCTHAQKIKEEAVPDQVRSAFTKMHAGVKNVKWEKEDGNYEAEYESKTEEGSVLFDATGNWLEKETEIKISELPVSVKEYVVNKYTGNKIKDASRINNSNGTVTYEAELEDKDLIFDSSGNFLNEEAKEKEDDDKDKD